MSVEQKDHSDFIIDILTPEVTMQHDAEAGHRRVGAFGGLMVKPPLLHGPEDPRAKPELSREQPHALSSPPEPAHDALSAGLTLTLEQVRCACSFPVKCLDIFRNVRSTDATDAHLVPHMQRRNVQCG